jgi:hypothetical protein
MCFRPHVMRETPTLWGLLERTNLNHWTTIFTRIREEVSSNLNRHTIYT